MPYEITIDASKTERHYWKDLWHYRELFVFLSWRDVMVRYKQTVIGIAWAILRPFLTMIILTIVFGKLAKLPSDGSPYPMLVFAALLPWQFFANALSDSSNSLIGNANLISKVYFPRLIIPASSVIVSFIDFLISAAILIALMAWYDFWPGWRVFFLPVFIFFAFAAAMGAGLIVSSLNVKYRDFRYIVPFIVQFGLYISPVGFSSNVIPDKWRLLYSLNPMVGVIEGFRWALLGQNIDFYYPGFLISIGLVALLFAGGLRYFRKTELHFADVI
jgi:lipopolysaccharide transport system permease protein